MVPLSKYNAADPESTLRVCAVDPVWVKLRRRKLPALKPEPPIERVLPEARLQVPPFCPKRTPLLEPVEFTEIFWVKLVPEATCATKVVPLPELVKVVLPLNVSGLDTPRIKSPLPVFTMVVVELKVFPPRL